MKRLVIIVPDCGEGGLFQFYNQLVPELARHIDVHVIFASPYYAPLAPSITGATCHFLPAEGAISESDRLLKGPLSIAPDIARAIAVAHRAWELALSLEPDCVEVCDWPLSFAPAVLAQAVPYVVQCHGSMAQIGEHDPQRGHGIGCSIMQLIEPQLVSAALKVQTYSSSNAHFWENRTSRAMQMIRPAFSLPDLAEGDCQINESAAVFGRLQRWKGPHILCDALRLLGPRAPVVDWYGGVKPWGTEGLLANQVLQRAYSDIWGDRFHHKPAVSRSAVADIQRRSLFNIVPSTWDVFNFTAVEAMAWGRPTIISTGAGASELIADGVNGFTFVNGDSESLAAAIDNLLTMPERRRMEVGMAGRETVRIQLDPALIVEQRLAGYEDAISSFEANRPRPPNPWLACCLASPPATEIDAGEVLEAFPLKILGRHMKDRAFRRFAQWVRQ